LTQWAGRFTKSGTPSSTPLTTTAPKRYVIITDGEENSSREYSSDKVKAQIERQKPQYGWELIFLGSNIDADSGTLWPPDRGGTELDYKAMSAAVAAFAKPERPMRLALRKYIKTLEEGEIVNNGTHYYS
jgi:hypothetical protein